MRNNMQIMRSDFLVVFSACLFWILCGVARVDAQPFAYISNSGSNSVSVIDLASNTVKAIVPVGTLPFGVAANAAGTRVYVSNNGSNTVSVIDTATNTVTATISVGDGPRGVAVHPNGSRVYVANFNSGTLSVIDATNNSVVDIVPVLSPYGVDVHPNGTIVYVASLGGGGISVIDTDTNTLSTTIPISGCPFGLALNPSGSALYVAQGCVNGLPVISTASNSQVATIPTVDGRFAVGVNPSGSRVYVTNDGNGRPDIMVINGGTNTLITRVALPEGSANGVAVHPDGTRFYVADEAQNVLRVFDAESNTEIASIPVGSRPIAFGRFIGPGPETCKIQDYTVPGFVPHLTQGPDTCWATAGAIMASWKVGRLLTERELTMQADRVFPRLHGHQSFHFHWQHDKGLILDEWRSFLGRLELQQKFFGLPSDPCDLASLLHESGPILVTTSFEALPASPHAQVIIGIHGDGSDTGTFLRVIDPDPVTQGIPHDVSFQTLKILVNNVPFIWPQWVQFVS